MPARLSAGTSELLAISLIIAIWAFIARGLMSGGVCVLSKSCSSGLPLSCALVNASIAARRAASLGQVSIASLRAISSLTWS
jgi:hypothetical protein